jgi:holin-like protein
MKYIYQIVIIFIITFIGEVLYKFIPLPIPASIYGLVIMLVCLKTKIIKLEQVKEAGSVLLETMPIMFIPAAVGLITVWKDVTNIILPIIIIVVLSTVLVMVTTGSTTQFILRRNRGEKQ